MLQVTRAREFPMVQVRTRLPESDEDARTIRVDLEIQFAGAGEFQLTRQRSDIQLSGTIPAKLSDFKIEPPSLLTLPVKNEMPVRVEMTWRRQ